MKAITLGLLGLAAALYLALPTGCGETVEGSDADVDGDADSDADSDSDADGPDLSGCDEAKTCAGMINAGTPEACIADFGYGTNQAGYDGNYNLGYIGFYGYNDLTSEMKPVPNYFKSEAAEKITSCDANNEWALHFVAEGFDGWGAGVGMNWGGPDNTDCTNGDQDPCLALRIADDHYKLEMATADTAKCPNEAALNCFKFGKNKFEPKDLSAYAGIGFWTLSSANNQVDTLKVTFPIPATMRFYSELYDAQFNYGGIDCNEDDTDKENDCYNDFLTTVNLEVKPTNPTATDNTNKWIYHEILFDDTTWSTFWGLKLDRLGMTNFPREQSMGIKFQVDGSSGAPMAQADFWIDDITLIK